MDREREDNRKGRNRDLRKEGLWRRRLLEQKESGLSVRAYCRREGFDAHRFHWWRREIARRDEGGATQSARPVFAQLLPVRGSAAFALAGAERPGRASCPGDPAAIDIVLRNGRALRVRRGFDAGLLLELADLIEASAC